MKLNPFSLYIFVFYFMKGAFLFCESSILLKIDEILYKDGMHATLQKKLCTETWINFETDI